MTPFENDILQLLARRRRPLNRREIAEALRLKGSQRKQLTRVLNQLERKGRLTEKRGAYRLARQERLMEGLFAATEKGFGFLRPDDPQGTDLFIPARHVGSAMDGDRIQVVYSRESRDGRPYGRVVKVLERAHPNLLGRVYAQGKRLLLEPLTVRLAGPLEIGGPAPVAPGDLVNVEVERYPGAGVTASGRVIERLGSADDPQADIEVVIRSHALPHQFSPAALDEAKAAAAAEQPSDRTDLRNLPLVTIDGETAMDFDDAVALRREDGGNHRLWVCIADVSHYVRPGGVLDAEALERGTSVYFPGFCLPMLPEVLSNGSCSLNPGVERLVLCAELLFSAAGVRLEQSFYPALMRSRARLTYTEVAAVLENPTASRLDAELTLQLQQMGELAEGLGRRRRERGSLDLELPEAEVILDERGAPRDVVPAERNRAHCLIEEFMLAANEAVAEFITAAGRGMLYRIHEAPDPAKLQDLQQLAAECGIGFSLGPDLQRDLQQLLQDVAGRPEARLLNQQLLRSLRQACYAADNRGHFGLASECYCHFTSPIRRYPDLVVHRVLKQLVAAGPKTALPAPKDLPYLGEICSARERRAMQAERDVIELRRCQVMAGRVGEEFSGIISSVAEFGFFVELERPFVEGLVHLRQLQDDYYHYDPTTLTLTGTERRRQFRVGLPVQVRVASVQPWRQRIDFVLIAVDE